MLKLIFLTIILLFDSTSSSFTIPLKLSNDGLLQLILQPVDKKVLVKLSLSQSTILVCCNPSRTIFQVVYYFLTNPFFHAYDFSCKEPISPKQLQTFKFPKIGLLELSYIPLESQTCKTGVLGLNKKSQFLSSIPIQSPIFSIKLSQGKNKQKSGIITFQQPTNNQPAQQYITIQSKGKELWQVQFQSMNFSQLKIDGSKFILETTPKQLKIPSIIYHKIIKYFIYYKDCRVINNQLLCPCQTGFPEKYPQFNFRLSSKFTFEINAQQYMYVEGQVCRVLISPSQTQLWSISILFFKNIQFKFNIYKNQITLIKFKQQTSTNELIKLPIQLILNCFVILILCVFVALVLIELLKRFSGLADARNEEFRQIMIRRQI